jgi:hypothetical protein
MAERIPRAFALALVCAVLLYSEGGTTAQSSAPLAASSTAYLLLIDTTSKTFTDPEVLKQLAFLNGSGGNAYNGAAVYMVYPDDADHHSSFSEFASSIPPIKSAFHGDVWPWVSWNRVVGYNPCNGSTNPSWCADTNSIPSTHTKALNYYEQINGIDLYDEAGALTDFLNLFRYALRTAKALGSPGIVFDPESYNNYKIQSTQSLATLHVGKTAQDIINRFEDIGRSMADIAHQEYDDAVILCFFTELFAPGRPQTYVIQGMLDEAKKKHYQLTLVSGGEGMDELGFCHPSLNGGSHSLEAAAKSFSNEFAPFLNPGSQSYYPNLQLGGTIAPWANSSQLIGWLVQNPPQTTAGYCGEAAQTLRTASDFIPLLHYLFTSYKYVWVLAAWDGRYSPYFAGLSHNPVAVATATAINSALQSAKQ